MLMQECPAEAAVCCLRTCTEADHCNVVVASAAVEAEAWLIAIRCHSLIIWLS